MGESEGAYVYQLTDHLGNVRAVITKVGSNVAISSSTDYYPGGMAMPGRKTVGGELYRYGYQGEYAETDPETGKPMFQLRLYDPRINRWLSPDPYGQHASPYMSMSNNWANVVDPDGGCDDGKGNLVSCPDDGTGIPHQLNEVVLRGKTNNTSGYVPNARDWEILAMLKQDFPSLYRSVNARYQKGDYHQLGGHNWGNFAAGWQRGGEDYHVDLNWHGISVSAEVAYPVNLNFLNRNSNTPNYGYGITLGLFNKPGFDDGGSFVTLKKAYEPALALGVNIDFISIETRDKNMTFHQGIEGPGLEVSGTFGLGVSRGVDMPVLNRNRHVPNTIMTSLSIGPGFNFGFADWKTHTYVFKK